MIIKLSTPTRSHENVSTAYNKRRNNTYVITNKDMKLGKTLLDTRLETEIAPLITINGAKFITIPRDGDTQNDDLDNILVSGVGAKLGLTKDEALQNHILRVEYDPDDTVFSYFYKKKGVSQELRSPNFYILRRKVADLPGSVGLRNMKYLLTPPEYADFFRDYRDGFVRFDAKNVDICSYKYEQIR